MAMGKQQGAGLLFLVVVAGLLLHDTRVADAQTLRVGYYNQTCRNAESIVADEVLKASYRDKGVLASLIRLHFHDCFVNVRSIETLGTMQYLSISSTLADLLTGTGTAAVHRPLFFHFISGLRRVGAAGV
jgi:hypothetical protein